jgi:hypothetical protein
LKPLEGLQFCFKIWAVGGEILDNNAVDERQEEEEARDS